MMQEDLFPGRWKREDQIRRSHAKSKKEWKEDVDLRKRRWYDIYSGALRRDKLVV